MRTRSLRGWGRAGSGNRTIRAAALLLTVGWWAAACAADGAPVVPEGNPSPPSSSEPAPAPVASTNSPPPDPLPELGWSGATEGLLRTVQAGAGLSGAPGAAPASRLRGGILLPFDRQENGWVQVTTPCSNRGWIETGEAARLPRPEVVIDPGHGGDEEGATGPTGLLEKQVNLAAALRTADALQARGVVTALTREQDFRASLAFRAKIAEVARPRAMVSIHHNAEPDGPSPGPGTETYYQYRSAESKRLAGLVYEEAVGALGTLQADWVADRDAGAKWRLNSRGDDYYGILRRTADAGVPAVLAEMLFIANPSEEALLRREETIGREAEALAGAVFRFLFTGDPGSGFTTPYPREAPAGPGGGVTGCVDPV